MVLTYALYIYFDLRAHYLVPAVYAPDQPSRAIEATSPTKGMRERCGWRKVPFNGNSLLLGWALAELVNNAGDIRHYKLPSA